MPLNLVVQSLQQARIATEKDLSRINQALRALNIRKPVQSEKRIMSADARRRISMAQKSRWAKWHRAKKKAA